MTRKLVTLRRVAAVAPIEGADAIEVATIDGWQVVVKKGELRPGDPVIYFELDSFLPEGNPAWQFLVDKAPTTFEGQRGHRLRTVKLRGQLSQGLALPLAKFPDLEAAVARGEPLEEDLSARLGVKKWELTLPANMQGVVKGEFPSFLAKTDQERAQNLVATIFSDLDAEYEVTLKLDGTSFTAYVKDGQVGVCSRNYELELTDANNGNAYVRALLDSGLGAALKVFGDNLAVQAELLGPGIQKNREKLKELTLFVFDIYDIDSRRRLPLRLRLPIFHELQRLSQRFGRGINHVPVIKGIVRLGDVATNLQELLAFAAGPSLNAPTREGVVFKRLDGDFSFKVINNEFLLREEQ